MSADRAAWTDDAPLFAAWQRYVTSDVAPFTIPGHKRRAALLDAGLARLLDADVPMYGGADTMRLTAGVLADAERRAAALWGADVCRFSTGGSTHANQVLLLAVGAPGDTVLVARNAHRSVLSGLVLAGLRPVWLPVGADPRTGAPTGVDAATLAAALAETPRAAAVLLTDPSYQGTLSDLPALVALAHAYDIPVVVDQAWGAHLGFTDPYPPHALACGADAAVTSAHKMLPAFSQASLVLARTARIDPDRLDRAFDATHTTSGSAAILGSTDAARAYLASADARAALRRLSDLAAGARAALTAEGLVALGPEAYAPGRYDPAKLAVSFAAAGRSGLAAEEALLERRVPVELGDLDTVVAQLGLTDDATTVARLLDGIRASLGGPAGPSREVAVPVVPVPPQRRTPREAFFAAYTTVPRAAAVGRVSAELVAPYPPGVPVLVPGEEITAATLAALDAATAAGKRIAYAADPALATLQVLAE